MERLNHALEPHRWAAIHFGEAPLGDCRRARRLQTIGEAMAATPGASIPQLFAHPYDVNALSLPGWQTLWRGMRKLDLLVQGVRLSRKLPGFG